jgi:hypothetical protein
MKQLRLVFLLCSILLIPSTGKAGQFEDGLLTLWESLWYQSGAPTLLNRWETDKVSYRYYGENIELHRKHFEKILAQTSVLTGIAFEDVSNQADAKEKAQFHVEVVSNNGNMPERLACYVRPLKVANFKFLQVELRMRDRHAYGCNLHEMMHAVGVHGHPSGDMANFAVGNGEVPRILIRSGMLVAATVSQARLDMHWLLGFSYQHGHIVNADLAKAEHWYASGAIRGNSPSMYLLGMLNESRGRIESDYLEKAYYWQTIATAYKHPSSTVARNRLAAKLSPETVAKLDAEAANFKPVN